MPRSQTCSATDDLGFEGLTSTVIATRGRAPRPLACPFLGRGPAAREFPGCLGIIEIDADDRLVAAVLFDVDDIDAALQNSTRGTSPAKRPPTRTRGRSSPRPSPR